MPANASCSKSQSILHSFCWLCLKNPAVSMRKAQGRVKLRAMGTSACALLAVQLCITSKVYLQGIGASAVHERCKFCAAAPSLKESKKGAYLKRVRLSGLHGWPSQLHCRRSLRSNITFMEDTTFISGTMTSILLVMCTKLHKKIHNME